jgi:hypothetical protein
MWTTLYFTPCPVTSCPACEPNSTDCEYSQPFRHIQYNRTANLRPMATLAILFSRRIARCGIDAASPGYTVSLLVLLPPARNAEARCLAY